MEMTVSTINILYVEDNDDNANMLSRRLTKRGFNVVTSSDGKAGVETAQALVPDIILMDLNLPVMDGIAATNYSKLMAKLLVFLLLLYPHMCFPANGRLQ